ncbi:MAG: Uncharacterised protein [Methanobacteriota archaeon]|nr:MAG: Uncharacterised protein [Euryarchaeota archaeon]
MGEAHKFSWLAHPTPRDGQVDMIQSCLDTLQKGGAHLASAPTGVGKTAAALAAALEFVEKSKQSKTVLFLTPKQSQHEIVVDTVRKINEQLKPSLKKVKLVDLIGRESMCEHVDKLTGRCTCEKNINESSNLNRKEDVRRYILAQPRHVGEIISMSKTWGVCAWAACRSAVKECDILVCDYNHLFIDEVRNASLKAMDLQLSDLVVIVDEAHNLADRVRMGMKRTLTPSMVRNAATEVEEHLGNLENMSLIGVASEESVQRKKWCLDVCKEFRLILNREFKSLIKKMGNNSEIRTDAKFVKSMFVRAFDAVAAIASQSTLDNKKKTFAVPDKNTRFPMLKSLLATNEVEVDENGDNEPSAHLLAHLVDLLLRFGESTALCLVFDGEGKDGRIIANLLDAGLVAGPIFENCSGSILMSGTLNPPSMFADLLGISNEKRSESIHESPFAKERRPVVVANDVTTLYRERSPENTQRIRDHIRQIVANTPGNVAVFVPSYAFLSSLFDSFHIPGIKTMLESDIKGKKDITDLLIRLQDQRKFGNRILMVGVFNGKLSEGVDYHGGLLDSVVCVGIPNAPPSVFQKSLGEYIKEKFGRDKFWRYANSQPAINSILQAMGRPIRAMGDRALILLLDNRNLTRTYSICYPKDIQMNQAPNSEASGRFAKRFFTKVPWIEGV